jgi:hypothetical protein
MAGTSININYITVSFHTNTDDKDDDTMVQVNISPYQGDAVTEIIATYTGNLGGHLADGSISQPVTLNWMTDSQWILGNKYTLQVIIDPNGHDTWRFDCYLYIHYNNTSFKNYPFLGHALSQNVRSNNYTFVL